MERRNNGHSGFECPACGAAVKPGRKYCPGCGFQPGGAAERKPGSRPVAKGILPIILFLLIGGILYIVFGLSPKPPFPGGREAAMAHGEGALPAEYGALVSRGNRLMDAGAYFEAIDHYTRALAVDSSDPGVIVDLGVCYHNVGDSEEAIRQFGRALVIEPRHAYALFNMGVVYQSLGRIDDTRTYWRRFIELDLDTPLTDSIKAFLRDLERP